MIEASLHDLKNENSNLKEENIALKNKLENLQESTLKLRRFTTFQNRMRVHFSFSAVEIRTMVNGSWESGLRPYKVQIHAEELNIYSMS